MYVSRYCVIQGKNLDSFFLCKQMANAIEGKLFGIKMKKKKLYKFALNYAY